MSKMREKLAKRLQADTKKVRKRIKTRRNELEENVREVVMGILKRLNLSTRDEISEIRGRLDRLSREVRSISKSVKKLEKGLNKS